MANKKKHPISLVQTFKKTHLGYIFFTRISIGMLASISSLFLFIKFTKYVLENNFLIIDKFIMNGIYIYRNPLLTKFMLLITYFGNEGIVILFILSILLLKLKNYKREALFLTFTVVMGITTNIMLKILIGRVRPDIAPLLILNDFSFPSGHSMNAFIFYTSVLYIFYCITGKKILSVVLGCLIGILIFVIGLSRIYLGVHYPSDVLGGFIAGFWIIITSIVIDKTFVYLNFFRNK